MPVYSDITWTLDTEEAEASEVKFAGKGIYLALQNLILINFCCILFKQHGKLVANPLTALSCTLASTREVSWHSNTASHWSELLITGLWLAEQSIEGWSWSGWVLLTKLWSLARGEGRKLLRGFYWKMKSLAFPRREGHACSVGSAGVCFSLRRKMFNKMSKQANTSKAAPAWGASG